MARPRKKKRPLQPENESQWSSMQKLLGYLLLVSGFLAVLIYVSQSIEIKNVAYSIQDLMDRKQALLEEKHRMEVALLEKQSFKEIETSLTEQGLPLTPGPRLKIVLEDDFSHPVLETNDVCQSDKDLWREWLSRMNQAQAMMTGQHQRAPQWRAPMFTREQIDTSAENKKQDKT